MVIHDDVRTLTARLVRERLGYLPSVIVGSPPCQDASTANTKGRGVDGERTGLFFEAIRLVDEIRPVWGCFENVPGIRTRGADRVCAALEALDYAVWPLVVGARHAGAPHRRDRVWFVFAADAEGDGRGQGRAWRPDPVHAGQQQQPFQGADAANAHDGRKPALAEHGEMGRASEPASGVSADAHSDALRPEQRRPDPGRAGAAELVVDDAADSDEARPAGRQLEPGIRAAQEPGHRCPFEQAWPDWNPRPADAGRVDDGLSSRLARQWIAAYGDAVVPQITEAIGRTMMRLSPTDGAVMDLFSGAAGGWSLGMERAGYRTVVMCEADPWRRAVLAERYAA